MLALKPSEPAPWKHAIAVVRTTVGARSAGAALLVRPDRLDLSEDAAVGDLLLVCNTAAYSAYLVLVRGTIARLGALRATASTFGQSSSGTPSQASRSDGVIR